MIEYSVRINGNQCHHSNRLILTQFQTLSFNKEIPVSGKLRKNLKLITLLNVYYINFSFVSSGWLGIFRKSQDIAFKAISVKVRMTGKF